MHYLSAVALVGLAANSPLGWWWMEENAWTPGRWLAMAGFETRFMFVGQRTVSVRRFHSCAKTRRVTRVRRRRRHH